MPEDTPQRGHRRSSGTPAPAGWLSATPRPDGRQARRAQRAVRTPAQRGVLLGGRIMAGLVSAAILVGTGFFWVEYHSFSGNVGVGAAIAAPAPIGSVTPSAYSGPAGQDQNILLLGNDSRAGATDAELRDLGTQNDGGSSNTDTMMILHVPADGSRATAVSFPRDTYVDIPGYGYSKLNSAYPDGYQTAADQGADATAQQSAGIQVLIATLDNLTGVQINHYVQINLLGFYRISQALGGVSVCLNAAQQEANSGIDLPAGVSVIAGKQALAFVRQRYGFPDGQGDLDRIKRQQYFLSAVFRQVLSAGTLLNPAKLGRLLNAVSSSLLIDPDLDLLALASQISDLQAGNLNFVTIPTTGFQDIGSVGSVVSIDEAAVKTFVAGQFNPDSVTPTPTPTPTPTDSSGVPTDTPTDTPTVEGSTNPTPVSAAQGGCIN